MKAKEFVSRITNKESAGMWGNMNVSTPQSGRTASDLGTSRFRISLDKENIKTPHFRMDRVLQMIEDRPNVANGLKQIIRFLLTDITFKGDDKRSVHFLNEWIKQRTQIKDEIFSFAYIWAGCGTGYIEPTYRKTQDGKKILDNIFNVPDPSVIYLNLFAKDESEYWLLRVPFDVRSFDGQNARYYPITYVRGSYIYRDFIWAIPYPKSKYFQKTLGWSRDGFYGTGLLSSAIDNADIEMEILKNWALIAKFRAMGKKIIGLYNENNEPVDPTELEKIKDQFMGLEEEDSLVINRKFVAEDLAFTGQDNSMDAQIEYLRKDTGSSLVPNYMTAFSQDSAMATASEAKIPFSLELKSLQHDLVNFFNKVIIDELRKTYTWLDESCTIDFGFPELYSRNEQFMMVGQLFNNRLATINEFRISAGLPAVKGGDKWGDLPPLDNVTVSQKVDDVKKEPVDVKKEKIQLKERPTPPTTFRERVAVIYSKEIQPPKVEGIASKQKEMREAVRFLLK